MRETALFGLYGGQIGCTDGRFVYLRAPDHPEYPKYEYTLMPTCHTAARRAFMPEAMLRQAELHKGFSFTKGMPVLKLKNEKNVSQSHYETALYDLAQDPDQKAPILDPTVWQRMEQQMQALMRQNDCPEEVFARYFGLAPERDTENR